MDDFLLPTSDCLDFHSDGDNCRGPVELRVPMSPTGKWYPRCEAHFDKRLATQDRLSRTYGTRRIYW